MIFFCIFDEKTLYGSKNRNVFKFYREFTIVVLLFDLIVSKLWHSINN